MDDISIVGIIIAALAFFVLGGVWYTVLFGKLWRAGCVIHVFWPKTL
jgi:hypothetical protein